MEESCRLHVRIVCLIELQVQSAEYIDVVNLEYGSRSCRKWEVMGVPCLYVVAAMKVRNIDLYDYCEHWYHTGLYQRTYNKVIHATRDRKQWEQCSYMLVRTGSTSIGK